MFIKQLETPRIVSSPFGPLTLTHEAYEYRISGMGLGQVRVDVIPGVMVPGVPDKAGNPTDPVFEGYESLRETRTLTGTEVKPLLAAKGPKRANDFRLSDAIEVSRGRPLP